MLGINSRQMYVNDLQLACNVLVFTSPWTLAILRSTSSIKGT